MVLLIRHGSTELDSSSPTERSSPVMLSAAKHLSASRDRPFAALRVTRGDCSNGQGLFFKLNLALRRIRLNLVFSRGKVRGLLLLIERIKSKKGHEFRPLGEAAWRILQNLYRI